MQAVEKPSTSVVLGLSPGKQDRYTCICCRVKFDSVELQRSHFKAEWHLYNIKRKLCGLEPIELASFNQIQTKCPPRDDEESDYDAPSFVDLGREDLDQASSSDGQTLDDDEWVKIDDEECDDFLDEDYTDDEIDEMLTRIVRPDTCLFCDKKSANIESNIEHMNSIHGFFIPEDQYLVDMQGLMNYLGFKVGAGSTCLWCNKQFTSLHGVRLHMLHKDHCKIFYDQELAVTEFKDFYDYSNQEQIEMKPLNELVVVKPSKRRCPSGGDSAGKSPAKHKSKFIKQQLVVAQTMGPALMSESYRIKRNIKKFNSDRAKSLLRVSLAHNLTLRARYKPQNPI